MDRKRSCILTNANGYYTIPLFIILFEYINYMSMFFEDDYDLILLKDNIYVRFLEQSHIFNNVLIFSDDIRFNVYDKVIKYEVKNSSATNSLYENASNELKFPYKDPFNIQDKRLKHLGSKYISAFDSVIDRNFILVNLSKETIKKNIPSLNCTGSFIIIDIGCTGLIDNALNIKVSSFDELFILLMHSCAFFTVDSSAANLAAFMDVRTYIDYNSCNSNSLRHSEEKSVKYFGRESDASISKSFLDITRVRSC